MHEILFSLSGFAVTAGMALAALLALAILAVFGVFLILLSARGERARLEAAGRMALEALRESFVKQVEYRDARVAALEARLDAALNDNAGIRAKAAGLAAQMEEQRLQAQLNLERYEQARQKMTEEFKAIAGEILHLNSTTFQQQNREQVDVLLRPLREQIGVFQTQLTKDRATVGEQIRALSENSLRMQTETSNLTRALKGSSQTQGAWGEMILSTILERSGLREGEQYRSQHSHSVEDDGRRQILRTDVEILMPNADVLVIDSKVSLTAFEAYSSCEDATERARHLQAHLASIRTHVKTLGDKNYQRHAGSSLDFVMMFMPIEAALAEAVRADERLIEFAIGQGVMLTTPTTLMTVLRTVRNVWDIEKRHENAERIAERAGALYEKVVGFLVSMEAVGKNLDRAQKSFSEARGQLQDGRGSVVRQVEMLRELGAKTNRQLPTGWETGAEASADAPIPIETTLDTET